MTPPANRNSFVALLLIALAAGAIIGWMDSRPNWDDTGVTVGAILVATALLGAAMPSRAWVWGLAVGLWIPLFSLLTAWHPASLSGLVFAFAGSYAGVVGRRTLAPPRQAS